MSIVTSYLRQMRQSRVRRHKIVAMLVCLSLIVAGGTVWSLHMTGEGQAVHTYCGFEEHQHTDDCYQKQLICGYEESDVECSEGSDAVENVHIHTEECYEISRSCGYEYEHIHTIACYSNPNADVETEEDWEKVFSGVGLSGNFSQDLIAIAKTQLGYAESTENYKVVTDGAENVTIKGYTRYGAWYGDPYGEWNAMFVSFCLYYAGVPEELFPFNASCSEWVEALSDEACDLYAPSSSNYIPNSGDIIFFDRDNDGVADNVGIVSDVFFDGVNAPVGIKTIEGDSGDCVVTRSYDLGDTSILGYGPISVFDDQSMTMAEGSDPTPSDHPALSYSTDRETFRAYMEYALPGTSSSSAGTIYTYGILRQTVLYVYAQAGETICLGSDIYNSVIDENDVIQSSDTGIDIVLIEPNGTKHTFDNELNGKGYIGSLAQEAAGANFTDSGNTAGYTPHQFVAPVTGIYEVRFHSYSGSRNKTAPTGTAHQQNNNDPKAVKCNSSDWKNGGYTIGAYDITVVKNGTVQHGRAFANYLALNIGANNVIYHLDNYVVTDDGYIYHVDAQIDPYGFVFFGNNRGIIDNTTGDSAYHSYKGATNSTTLGELNISIHNPMDPDTITDKTYKIFFEEPDPILEGPVYKKAFAPEHITEIEFVGAKEGNITYVGNGGYFKFEVDNATSVTITINFDKFNEQHGLTGDEAYQTVTLTSHVSQGINYIFWDGNDEVGKTLPAAYYKNSNINVTVQTHAGEFHFSFLDVENSEYTTFERINKIYDYDTDGNLIDVTENYADSANTIFYNNSVTEANKSKYIKATGVTKIANGYDASSGWDSSKKTGEGALTYSGNAGDFAFFDLWTYTVNTAEEITTMTIVIQELHGYDPVTLKGLVFFDRNKDGVYNIGDSDFTLADVEVALDYYYCGTRWGITRVDNDDPTSQITKLTPVAVTHTEYNGTDSEGNPIDPIEIIDYYYHHYEVRLEDGKYYLYKYADTDTKHEGTAVHVTDINGTAVEVQINQYIYYDDYGNKKTDYKVWIPVHKTTTTSNTGEYIFSGVLVNQNIDIKNESADIQNAYGNVVITVTNPDASLYTLTTAEVHTGDFDANDKGTEVQTLKLSDIEAKIAADRAAGKITFSYEAADIGYWFELYEPPLTVAKIWGTDSLSNDVAKITVWLEGFGVNDGNIYYGCELTFDARDNWEVDPIVIPSFAIKVDGEGNPILDSEGNPQKEPLSYRVTWEQFTKGGTIYRFIRDYATDTTTYKKASTDSEGNVVTDSAGNIVWIDLGATPAPYESFILDLQHTITGDIIYVENWKSDSTILTLTKKSAADKTLLLPEATFELLKLNALGQYESIRTGYGGSYMITTDENGLAVFHGLTAGNYQLREVVAPADYRKVDNIIFTVMENTDGQAYIVDNPTANLSDGKITVYDDLDEPLASGISKYNQYDELLTYPAEQADKFAAQFEVYAAYSSFNKISAVPVATVTVDSNGKAVFKTLDGTRALYISELKTLLGSNYFILSETHVPAGYRAVGEAHLEIIGSGMSTYVECLNPFESGVWTGQKVTVYAPDTLQVADSDDWNKISSDPYVDTNGVIQYATYSSGDGKITGTGTLFAVVLKRCGAESGVTTLTDLTLNGWKPVYGDDISGYTVMSDGSMASIIQAAKASQAAYGEAVFTPNESGVSMNATLTNLPGESTRYFTYMYDNHISGTDTEPQYVVAYYYSTANTLENATPSNTVRVTSHGLAGDADDFRLYWATDIEIPDIVNALFVQKTDVYENAVDGAVFALYDAESDISGKGYYIGKDESNNPVYICLGEDENKTATVYNTSYDVLGTGTYTVNTARFSEKIKTITYDMLTSSNAYLTEMFPDLASTAGIITVTVGGSTYTVTPSKNANDVSCMTVTHDNCGLVDENGSGHLRYLEQGKYYLKEIYVPAGYDLNYANVEVAVTNQGVYANAGTDGDGVRVGNGAGYLVSTMNVFASIGDIDETLSYIIGNQVTNSSAEFLTEPIMTESGKLLYLKYAGSANSTATSDEDFVLFDYLNRIEGEDALRLWVEAGWSDMKILQDYSWGSSKTLSTTRYVNLYGIDISALFSGSTFVRFQDDSVLDLKVTKVDSMDAAKKLSDASFVLYYKDSSNINHYYTRSEDITSWESLTSGKTEKDYKLTTATDGTIEFQALTNGTYYLKEIDSPNGYDPLTYLVVITVKDGVITISRSDGVAISDSSKLKLSTPYYESDRYVYNLSVPNNGGYELPQTGGAGTHMFTIVGLLFITVSLVLGCGLRHRRERGLK